MGRRYPTEPQKVTPGPKLPIHLERENWYHVEVATWRDDDKNDRIRFIVFADTIEQARIAVSHHMFTLKERVRVEYISHKNYRKEATKLVKAGEYIVYGDYHYESKT